MVGGRAPGDLVVDSRDLAAVLRRVASGPAQAAGPGDPYDVNRDGAVDNADVATVRRNLHQSLAPLTTPAAAAVVSPLNAVSDRLGAPRIARPPRRGLLDYDNPGTLA